MAKAKLKHAPRRAGGEGSQTNDKRWPRATNEIAHLVGFNCSAPLIINTMIQSPGLQSQLNFFLTQCRPRTGGAGYDKKNTERLNS